MNPVYSDWHYQIILGTVLGGSSIVKPAKGKNCYLFMRSTNEHWINYKAAELSCFASQSPFNREGNTIRWHSNCYPVFKSLRDLLYEGKTKVINSDALDKLRDIGLAIWYGDCGKLENGQITLNTNQFDDHGSEVVKSYFHQAGIGESSIVKTRGGSSRVQLSKEATEKFLMTVASRLPDFSHAELLGGVVQTT
jgi:hypothetical protein